VVSVPVKLRWGVAGCGWVARDYVLPALDAVPSCEVVALLDPDPGQLAAIETAPTAGRHTSLDAFLGEPDLEAVYVAAPNHLHAPLVGAAARAGKHVLCEKPMAPTLEEAERMVTACERAGVVYATAFDQRFHAAHRRLRDLVEDGALGTVSSARIHYACWLPPEWSEDNWRADPERAGGGAFMDLAPHGLDLLRYVLGEDLEEVRCLFQRRVHDYAVEDGAALVGRTTGGVLVLQHVSYNTPETYPRRDLEVSGTRALAVANNTLGQDSGGKLELVDAASGERKPVDIPPKEDRSPFERQVEAFAGALLGGEEFPFSARADLHLMRLLEKVTEEANISLSAAGGRG
jgi:1,5-anhydro-D-fructose reductase (1,5-anhydro-D-mannitol-forming)